MNDENRAESGTKILALCPAVRSDALSEDETSTELAKVAELCQRPPIRRVGIRASRLSRTEGVANAILQGFSPDSTSRSQLRNWLGSTPVETAEDFPSLSGESVGVAAGGGPIN